MNTIIFILVFILVIIFARGKVKKWIIVAFSIFFMVMLLDPKWLFNKYVEDNGYGERLEPIEAEIHKIDNYKKAVNLILKKHLRVLEEDQINNNNSGLYRSYPHLLADSIVSIQKDSLNLRFIAYPMWTEIKNKDTIIEFNASSGDYNMVSNKANKLLEIPPYFIYRHSIIYSSKPLGPSEYVTKIEDKLYYMISEYDEY